MLLNIFTSTAPNGPPRIEGAGESQKRSYFRDHTNKKEHRATLKKGNRHENYKKYDKQDKQSRDDKFQKKRFENKENDAVQKSNDHFESNEAPLKRQRTNKHSDKQERPNSKSKFEKPKTDAVTPANPAEAVEEKKKVIFQSKTAHHKIFIPESLHELPQLQQRAAEDLSKKDMNKVGQGFEKIKSSKEITFKSLGLPERLVNHLVESGYGKPTTIQSRSIPALSGVRDALIKSQTGSGKTLAYLLPILRHLGELPARLERCDGTKAVILAPTRELAVQIERVYKVISKPYYWIIASTLMGGENKKAEKARLRKGAHIVIGTPGRIRDHIETTQSWNLSRVRWFILDEADRLIDLGFEETVRFIFNFINTLTNKNRPDERQRNVLVSATLSKDTAVDRLAGEIMNNPVFIGFTEDEEQENAENESSKDKGPTIQLLDDSSKPIATLDSETSDSTEEKAITVHTTPALLEQLYVQMSTRHRLVALASFLRLRVVSAQKTGKKCKMIVFVSTCAEVEFLYKIFSHTFWPDFESGQVPVVVTKEEDEVVQKAKTEEEREADKLRREKEEIQAAKAASPAQQPRIPLLDTQLWKLHGNLLQKTRTSTYFEFSKASEGILFCTDVAARGLDLPAVDWIVQFDAPEDTEDYIHRVGRTARIGHEGKAIIFLVESEIEYLTVLRRHGISLTPFSLERVLGGLHSGIQRSVAQHQRQSHLPAGAILQKQLETMVTVSPDLMNLAKEAYVSYLRAYAAYPKALKPIFHTKKLHFGEVAHSFGLTERPSEVGKTAADIHTQTKATVNPVAAKADAPKINYGPAGPPVAPETTKSDARREKYAGRSNAKGAAKQLSLHQIAKKQSKQAELAEFM